MLDKRCFALLKIINDQCVDSGYKVFSVDELISAMPNNLGVDSAVIFLCIKSLLEHEYISVKYQDEREICVIPLIKGRLVFEKAIEEEIEKNNTSKKYFAYSLVGAIIGGVIGGTIFAIIQAVLGA
ncbi:MAG: hypothetical protein E7373_04565 [Clostridiales bacterium]|nr:hypothetical protein [Clostridiales bacterium]